MENWPDGKRFELRCSLTDKDGEVYSRVVVVTDTMLQCMAQDAYEELVMDLVQKLFGRPLKTMKDEHARIRKH